MSEHMTLEKLRMKEMTTKLSYSEQQQLEFLIDDLENSHFPDCREKQLTSEVKVMAIRNYVFQDVTPKESFFQKLKGLENSKKYILEVFQEEDATADVWLYHFALDVRQLMADVGLGLYWKKMLPVAEDLFYWIPMDEEDKEWFQSFPDPAWCYEKLQQAKDLEERASAHSSEMLEAVRWLKVYWAKGYHIYADIEDLFCIE